VRKGEKKKSGPQGCGKRAHRPKAGPRKKNNSRKRRNDENKWGTDEDRYRWGKVKVGEGRGDHRLLYRNSQPGMGGVIQIKKTKNIRRPGNQREGPERP